MILCLRNSVLSLTRLQEALSSATDTGVRYELGREVWIVPQRNMEMIQYNTFCTDDLVQPCHLDDSPFTQGLDHLHKTSVE